MLAGAPSPHGYGATPRSAGTLSEGARTVCCLAALPRGVRSMGRTVCLLLAQTISPVALQVTACEAPQGSLLAYASGDVVGVADATGICSITEQHSLSP